MAQDDRTTQQVSMTVATMHINPVSKVISGNLHGKWQWWLPNQPHICWWQFWVCLLSVCKACRSLIFLSQSILWQSTVYYVPAYVHEREKCTASSLGLGLDHTGHNHRELYQRPGHSRRSEINVQHHNSPTPTDMDTLK